MKPQSMDFSVSQTIDYQLTVGSLSASVSGFDINEPSAEAVASSMIENSEQTHRSLTRLEWLQRQIKVTNSCLPLRD